MPATRADSQLVHSAMAYWGMSQVIDHPLAPVQLRSAELRSADPAGPPTARPQSEQVHRPTPRRSPTGAVRHATAVTLPVLLGWAEQSVAAFAGFWLGLLCLAPLHLPIPPWSVLLVSVAGAVVAACLSAGQPSAAAGRWLTITAGWAVLLSVGMTTALQLGPVPAGVVPLVTLAAAIWIGRVSATPEENPSGARAMTTVTALAAALAVAVGPAAANGVLVLSDRPPAPVAVLLATWAVGLVGVAVALGRGAPELKDLVIICTGVVAAFTTTAVLAAGLPLWHDAFGRSTTRWSDATAWWAYALAVAVLAVALAGQIRLGRSIRLAGSPDRAAAPFAAPAAERSISRLGLLMAGSLTAAAAGATVGVAAMASGDQLVLPPLLFVVPVTAGSYVVTRAACARLAADPPRRVDHRDPVRYGWLAGWTAVLTVVLALSTLALAKVLPHLDAAGLTVAAAVCTVVGGVAGQLPVDRAFRWARRQTGPTLAHHAMRFAAQSAAALGGVVVALLVLAQLDSVEPTPPGIVVAVVVAALAIVVVDLAGTGTVVSCVLVMVGAAAATVAACWLQAQVDGRIGSGPLPQVMVLIAGLAAVSVAAVYLVRFAAELTRNTRGERSNHAFSALVFAATAAGVVYGILALAA